MNTYYDKHADDFVARTTALVPEASYQAFLPRLRPGCRILDAGFGSGRDIRHFLAAGFDAHGFDASLPLVERAQQDISRHRLRHLAFEDFSDPAGSWDAIWAMASLIHVDEGRQTDVLARLINSLAPGGTLTAYYKSGATPHIDGIGRYIFPLTLASAVSLCADFAADGHLTECFDETAADSRGAVITWIGITITKRNAEASKTQTP